MLMPQRMAVKEFGFHLTLMPKLTIKHNAVSVAQSKKTKEARFRFT